MTAENAVRFPAMFRPADSPQRKPLWDRNAQMTTHFNGDCPAMKPGDETVDAEKLAVEGWAYDCRTCRYTEQRVHRAWEGGFLNALQLALFQ